VGYLPAEEGSHQASGRILADGYLPEFFDMTTGKEHEINWVKALKLPAGLFAVFDRYTDLHRQTQGQCLGQVFQEAPWPESQRRHCRPGDCAQGRQRQADSGPWRHEWSAAFVCEESLPARGGRIALLLAAMKAGFAGEVDIFIGEHRNNARRRRFGKPRLVGNFQNGLAFVI